jgi:hypothetical protein
MSLRKAVVLEMASAAYEMDAAVKRGVLLKADDGRWTMADEDLAAWLDQFAGREIVLIAASLTDERPVEPRTCGICGREFFGLECPHCRDARIRLRGR